MRRYSPTYLIGQGAKGLWRNGVMSLASITVLLSCLIVMGCFALLVANIDFNLEKIGDLNVITVFVDDNDVYEEGSEVPLAGSVIALDSSAQFLGWSLDPEAKTAEFPANGTYTVSASDAVSGNVTMYAVWSDAPEVDGYTVRYHDSGLKIEGALYIDTNLYKAGSEVKIAPALTARYSSISFLGWSTVPGATEAQYAPGSFYYLDDSMVVGGVVNFYAVWSQMPAFSNYTVSYDTNRVPIVGDVPTDEVARAQRVEAQIKSLDNVSSVTHTSPEEVMEQMYIKFVEAGYPELASAISEGENPYRHEFTVSYSDNNAVDTLEFQLTHMDGVAKVNCRTDYAEKIESLKSGIILIFTWFMVILFVVSVFVIVNTIKLAVFARRQEISIMRYVGATNWFIVTPFVVEGVIIGLIASVIAFIIQYYIYGYIQKILISDINMLSLISFGDVRGYLAVGFLAIGVLTGIIGSCISLRKHLKA